MNSIFEITADWAEAAHLVLYKQKEVDSTNDWAKEKAFEDESAISLYLADHQTKGRGRGRHSWKDRAQGHCLLSSWSFLMLEAPQPVLAPALGLSLFKSAQATWLGGPWSLKAPNDLYLAEKKVGGLLLESVQEGNQSRLIVGLGLNVTSHPEIDQSGCLADFFSQEELAPEMWRQFLDRLLLEITSTLLIAGPLLHPTQQKGLQFALNLFPPKAGQVAQVLPDGGLVYTDGQKVSWIQL